MNNEESPPLKNLSIDTIQDHFPIFSRFQDSPLHYLDSAASAQKPQAVIDRLVRYLCYEHANIHRGAYALSAEATLSYEKARESVRRFVGAKNARSIILTRGTTEGINLIAHAFEQNIKEGDFILLSLLEHHSNIVPWQLMAKRRKARIGFIEMNEDATLDMMDFEVKLKSLRPKLIAVTALSNAFGTVTPIQKMIDVAHSYGAKILVDAAQSVCHSPLNVEKLDPDFLVFSGHKLYGPTGIGALYVKEENYELMDPFHGGGDMIASVTTEGSTWAEEPRKFEAGTPPIAEALGLGTAIEFVEALGWEQILSHEERIFSFGVELLQSEPGVTLYGPVKSGKEQQSIISFNIEGIHPHDLATIADSMNVNFRGGHHCAMPALKRLGIRASARASIGVYTQEDDFLALLEVVRHARKIFG